MSNQAALDTDRKIIVIVPPGYTMRADGIILSDGGKDCLQAPEHRTGAKLEAISQGENGRYCAAHETHRADVAQWKHELDEARAPQLEGKPWVGGEPPVLSDEDEAAFLAAQPGCPAAPVRYLSHAGNCVQTKPSQSPPKGP